MKCPICNTNYKSIYELNDSESNVPWYKYKEEQLICPKCKTLLELQASKKLKFKLLVIIITYGVLTIGAFFYSIILFISLAIFGTFLATVMINYLIFKKGVLVEKNT